MDIMNVVIDIPIRDRDSKQTWAQSTIQAECTFPFYNVKDNLVGRLAKELGNVLHTDRYI